MSKSDANVNAWVAILDKPEDIMRKFKRAVTDSENKVRYDK
jgi:tryptophanyl-tRNA synthetase